jgi:hypothetical protein
MSIVGQRIRFEPIRSLAFGSISGAYAKVGTPFVNAVRCIIVDNFTNANMTISFDGINDHMVVFSSSSKIIDYASNRVGPVDQLEQSAGTQVYVKQTTGAPSSGSIYVSVVYASFN